MAAGGKEAGVARGNTECLEKRSQVFLWVLWKVGGLGMFNLLNDLLPGACTPCHKRLKCVVVYRDKGRSLSNI